MRLSGEIADGNLPIFMSPESSRPGGRADLGGHGEGGPLPSTSPLTTSRPIPYPRRRRPAGLPRRGCKPELALYIGGMGARGKNFYNDYACGSATRKRRRKIQDVFLDGRKDDAAALVPDKLVDEIALVGPADRIRGRLQAWKAVGEDHKVGTLVLTGATPRGAAGGGGGGAVGGRNP